MKGLLIFIALVLCCPVWIEAQAPVRGQTAMEAQGRTRPSGGEPSLSGNISGPNIIRAGIGSLIYEEYHKPTKEELGKIAPNKEDLDKFADFLHQPKTGLTKLIGDTGCAQNANLVIVSADCLKYPLPGGGSSYSFRTSRYRIQRIADLTFINGVFSSSGLLAQGILVGIGDVPLAETALQTRGLKYLVDFQPQTDYEAAKKAADQFREGVDKDDFIYRRELKAVENMTYVLRSIAYSGKSIRTLQGMTFNEFEFDKRKDIIVAFRIVRKDSDGSVTLLWKELSRKDSPKIKRSVNENDKSEKDTF